MKLGVEVLLSNPKMLKSLKGKRVGLVCHPASVDENLQHSLDLLSKKIKLSCAFGPQHGVRGDKQDNMIESPDFVDPVHKIPIFSLYGEVRRPTPEMMQHFDVLLFDLQDLGCRIYTFITTLLYVMEECAKLGKSVIVLDRPNPAGRPIEGFKMLPGWESFVGAAPIPMRHGLTVGELALYFKDFYKMNLDLQIVKMKGYSPDKGPGFGWDTKRPWVNPSPNAASLNMARAYSGTVLIEGTTLSEARGTTRALEIIGASDIDFAEVLVRMKKKAPQWHKGVTLRECFFEPTFHKHVGKLCHGFQFHTDANSYKHDQFKPFRLVALMLKVIREMHPKYPIYRDFAYEYVRDRLAFDVINGGPALKDWIENSKATPKDLDAALAKDEKSWAKERKKYLLY
ncbi:exo-beta-N-acetylmuramidase NamZ domain-containing protein [Bdellovibrio bacteriovorus]|uniref:exo-beta-N-acetylmuramidase NamZ family protein n=1 Tax=Bdellovibrio bacteriovorus TaxID=959 RepID=UPI0035A8A9AB